MTDVLLVQPPIRDFYLTGQRTVPYGLRAIAAALAQAGFSARILDGLARSRAREIVWPTELRYLQEYFGRDDLSPFALFHRFRHYGYSIVQLAGEAQRSGAPLIGISSLFSAYAGEALKLAQAIKAAAPQSQLVLGGHHPTALPQQVLANRAVDFVLRGEGEITLPALARALRSGGGLDQVPGLAHRLPGGGLQLAAPAFASSLAELPPPIPPARNPERAVVVASRGCPYRCSYCSVGAGALPYRRRPVAAVLAEIADAVAQGARLIDFEDENLSGDRGWFLELLTQLAEHPPEQRLELRAMNGLLPHTLDREVVQAMGRAGFRVLNLSLGSFCAEQLRRFRRPDERAAFDRALSLAKACGLQAVGYIIVAAPDQEARRSLEDLLQLASRRVLAGVSIFYPAPGSADYQTCLEAGLLPASLSQLRATALPLSQRTTRLEAVTLWRLGRLLNFIKGLLDEGMALPPPAPAPLQLETSDRQALGLALLRGFLADGVLRGVDRDGQVYAHQASPALCQTFRQGLLQRPLRGTRR